MARKLGAMNANTPLVKNLTNNQYMDLLLDGCRCLEEVFSKIDAEDVHIQMQKEKQGKEKIPVKIRKMLKSETFPKKLLESVSLMMK